MERKQVAIADLVAGFIDRGELESDPAFVVRWSLNQFARNDWDTLSAVEQQHALEVGPPTTGHSGWDGFFAGLAHYLAERDGLGVPDWVSDPERVNVGDMFYPVNNAVDPVAAARRVALDPAGWFTDRGVGIVLRSLPSGKGKHVPAGL